MSRDGSASWRGGTGAGRNAVCSVGARGPVRCRPGTQGVGRCQVAQEMHLEAAESARVCVESDWACIRGRAPTRGAPTGQAAWIAHVVTDKLDVRAAAASLSPEPAEQGPVGRLPVS